MTSITQSQAKELFSRYIDAWNARDFPRMAAFFSEPSTFVLEAGTTINRDRAALMELFRTIFVGLDERGFDHTEIGIVEVRPCARGIAIMDVADITRFDKRGIAFEVMDAHFTIREIGREWKFVTVVWCAHGWRHMKEAKHDV